MFRYGLEGLGGGLEGESSERAGVGDVIFADTQDEEVSFASVLNANNGSSSPEEERASSRDRVTSNTPSQLRLRIFT